MKVIVLGSSGSVAAPHNPASGYLIQPNHGPSIIMDMGPGVLAKLQQYHDPNDAHVIFSHLHPDHCLDFPSLLVWRRYHPTQPAPARNLCAGPIATPDHLGRLSADIPGEIDDMSDTFAFTYWEKHIPQLFDTVTITPYPAIHPIESYSLRIVENSTGKTIAYSGDTAYTEELIECANEADIFLCEATWGDTSANKAADMHMSGGEAGIIATKARAKKLVLVHIPPWVDAQAAKESAAQHYDGPIEVAYSGLKLMI
ncbi:metal-dependent hydrolase, beta-lactamase superfamily III [Corynebacterium mustelae]|uniref:Metal-dependent hydrolase, beta-lactamase superfamily III n=1 Tax=Corynebacterium mustelae TaxID=571915 RepID=A0A0G3H065_9CORY|nr:MBL fold metallo-hydrolase [Corynebacterium mustelae]AKK06804.1 metal-dependent hydrolase, beta-lactamase superfamily III [Corynebacterium mustelae]